MRRSKLLILSEDPTTRRALGAALSVDYEILFEQDASKALELVRQRDVDVLLIDFDPRTDRSLPLIENAVGARATKAPVLILTDDADRAAGLEFVRRGAFDALRKPPHLIELRLLIQRAIEYARVQRGLPASRENGAGCDALIGSSAVMKKVFALIERIADLDVNVMIRGESGTGKELIARAIHKVSHRAQHPFLPVSLGAVPESLIEAELFGHQKGAFTGADRPRAGHLEVVGEGTLFLDEVGEMSPTTQMKLLRVLQEKQFTRVGTSTPQTLKARIVFATHRDLEEMVRGGEFREDLYYRMHVVRIDAPALRDRVTDIPVLAEAFLSRYALAYRSPAESLSSGALRLLCQHEWPGNVRELENVIQQAVVLAEDEEIGPEAISQAFRSGLGIESPALRTAQLPEGAPFEDQVRDFKLRLVQQTLTECEGNKTAAAQKLGITRAYLHRILRKSVDSERGDDEHDSGRINFA
jgi:DNA-binding NtrC family response regulator